MCGIFGCIIREGQASKLIIDGLKRLEYRGYDSTGVAIIDNNEMEIRKDKGRIEESGTHAELMRKHEKYYELVSREQKALKVIGVVE